MESLVLEVPAMYADHHVVEVRRLLLEVSGVEAVDASSAFRVVEARFDPDRTSVDALRRRLEDAGYLGEPNVPLESGEPTVDQEGTAYFRHSTAYEIAGTSVGFGQEVPPPGRPLWPCPGFDAAPARSALEEDD